MHTLSLHTLIVVKVVSQQSELCVLCALTSVDALFYFTEEKRMKKLFALRLTLVFVLALAECENTGSGAKQNNNAVL